MKIIVDGDGCPVIGITMKVADKFKKKVLIICDTSHDFSKYKVETITVSKGNDSADFLIVNKVLKGDIVVTQDYGLAAMVLGRGAYVINQNGFIYSNSNIDQLLFNRHICKKIRQSKGRIKGPKKRSKEDDIRFEEVLSKLLKELEN